MATDGINRKAPVPQDAKSLRKLMADALRAIGHLEDSVRTMGEDPAVDVVEMRNFWIFYDGIDAIKTFEQSASKAIRNAKLGKGAFNAEGASPPQRDAERLAEESPPEPATKKKKKARK